MPERWWVYAGVAALSAALTAGLGIWRARLEPRPAFGALVMPDRALITGVWTAANPRSKMSQRCEFRRDFTFNCDVTYDGGKRLEQLGHYNLVRTAPNEFLLVFRNDADSPYRPNRMVATGFEIIGADAIRDVKEGTIVRRDPYAEP